MDPSAVCVSGFDRFSVVHNLPHLPFRCSGKTCGAPSVDCDFRPGTDTVKIASLSHARIIELAFLRAAIWNETIPEQLKAHKEIETETKLA